MAGNFNQSMNQTARDFQSIILPIFKGLWRGCEFIHSETQSDGLSRALDDYAGIDIIKINPKAQSVIGIASRIQRSDKCWATFTIRCQRDNGTPTEFLKRTQSLQSEGLFPLLTYQAYISRQSTLLGMAIARTKDILSFIAKHKPPIKHTNQEQIGQASFLVIEWQVFIQCYELIRVTPDKNGFLAKWSRGERFIAKENHHEETHAI